MKFSRLLIAKLLLFSVVKASSYELTPSEKRMEFTSLLAEIRSGYALLDYKIEEQNIPFNEISKQYMESLVNTSSNRDYYYGLIRFLAEFRDGHVKAVLPTRHKAILPIDTDYVEDRVVVVHSKTKQIRVGDEILEFNGRPVKQALEELVSYISSGSRRTAIREATWSLAFRAGSRIPVPAKKDVSLKLRTHSGVSYLADLEWSYHGSFQDEAPKSFLAQNPSLTPSELTSSYPSDLADNKKEELFPKRTLLAGRNSKCNPKSRIAIPKNAKRIKANFTAYIWKTQGKTLGYIRLHHYEFGGKDLGRYKYIVRRMEKLTDGLIIDQSHNCGGALANLYEMASLFLKAPATPLSFRILGSKKLKIRYENAAAPSALGSSKMKIHMKDIAEAVSSAWRSGSRLSRPIFLGAASGKVMPAKSNYTKPVIILADELSSSAGDMFPAFLQGLGRAKVLGVRTAGLGGHQSQDLAFLPFSGIRFFLTKSMTLRSDGTPIENNGVAPDIPYEISVEDTFNGFKEYREFYTKELLKMI